MKKNLLLAFACMALSLTAIAQSIVKYPLAEFPNCYYDYVHQLSNSPNLMIKGHCGIPGNEPVFSQIHLMDSNCDILQTHSTGAGDFDKGGILLETTSGLIYDLSFQTVNGQAGNTRLKRLNHDGDTLWSLNLGGIDSVCYTQNMVMEGHDAITAASVSYSVPKYENLNQKIDLWAERIDSSGNVVWKKHLSDSLIFESLGAVKIADGQILIMALIKGSDNTKLFCIDPDGQILWTRLHPSLTSTTNDVQVINQNLFRIYTHTFVSNIYEILNYSEYDMNGNPVYASLNSTPRIITYIGVMDGTRRVEATTIISPDSFVLLRVVDNNNSVLSSLSIPGFYGVWHAEKTGTNTFLMLAAQLQDYPILHYEIWKVDMTATASLPFVSANMFSISPNPGNGYINLTFNRQSLPGKMNVFSATGQLLKELDTKNETEYIDLTDAPQGFYFLNYTSSDGKSGCNKKVIITR
jgi:hypothetical protein